MGALTLPASGLVYIDTMTLMQTTFEQSLLGTEMRLLPITQPILREAARLRATTKLRTPDALHAARRCAATPTWSAKPSAAASRGAN